MAKTYDVVLPVDLLDEVPRDVDCDKLRLVLKAYQKHKTAPEIASVTHFGVRMVGRLIRELELYQEWKSVSDFAEQMSLAESDRYKNCWHLRQIFSWWTTEQTIREYA